MAINLKVRDREGERVIEMRQDRATFGRSSDCTVQIEDTMASREHCRIEKVSDSEFKLIDLESRNGTRVNGMHVNQHKLGHGDQIQIGEVTVVFDNPGPGGRKASGVSPARAPSGMRKSQAGSRSKHTTRRVGRRRGKGAGNELAIVGAVACLLLAIVALAMVTGGSSDGDSKPAKILAKAQQHYDDGEYDEAEEWADRISASKYPNHYESAQALKGKIEQARAAADDDLKARDAQMQFKQAQVDEKKGKLKGDKLLAAYNEVIRLYPGTAAANQARARLAELQEGRASQSDPLAALAKNVARFVERNEFQSAIELYQRYWEKTGDQKANDAIKTLDQQGDRAYRNLHNRAQAALSGGQKQRAREYYQEVKRTFGGKWAQLADSELSKID